MQKLSDKLKVYLGIWSDDKDDTFFVEGVIELEKQIAEKDAEIERLSRDDLPDND